MRRSSVLKCGGLALVVVFLFCFCLEPAAVAAPKTLRIGFTTGLSGFASENERIFAQGAELAKDWINEKGGVTIKGEKYLVELAIEDNKCSADGSVAAAKKLVDENVKYVGGGVMPFVTAAQGTVTEPAKVIRSVINNCGSPQEMNPNTPYTFLSQNAVVGGTIAAMSWMKKKFPQIKTIVDFIPDDFTVEYMRPKIVKIAKGYGLEVKDIIPFALNTVDYTPYAMKALKMNTDAITMTTGWPEMIAGVLKPLRQNGYAKPVVGCHFTEIKDVLNIVGKEIGDNYFVQGINPDDPGLTDMEKMILERGKAKYGHDRLDLLCESFDSVWVIVQAIQKAQSLDTDDVRKAWENMDTIQTTNGLSHMGGKETYGLRHAVVGPRPVAGLEKGQIKFYGWIRDITVP